MTKDEAGAVLADAGSGERLQIARLVEALRGLDRAGIKFESVVDSLCDLRPSEVIEVVAFARRKRERRRRPR